jgi:hypothetical protein
LCNLSLIYFLLLSINGNLHNRTLYNFFVCWAPLKVYPPPGVLGGVFGCDEQQVLRVVVDVVEQLGPVVAAAVGADVDGLLGEIASRSQLRLSVVGPERNLVLMGERPKVRVSFAVADVSQGSFRRLVVADHRPVAYQIVQLVLKVVFLVVLLDRNARAAAGLNVRRIIVGGVV